VIRADDLLQVSKEGCSKHAAIIAPAGSGGNTEATQTKARRPPKKWGNPAQIYWFLGVNDGILSVLGIVERSFTFFDLGATQWVSS
jgi:hypothetical protein